MGPDLRTLSKVDKSRLLLRSGVCRRYSSFCMLMLFFNRTSASCERISDRRSTALSSSLTNCSSELHLGLVLLHRVSKNVPPSTCYNLDIHDPITIIFGRSITEKVRNRTMLCFPTSPISSAATLPCEIRNQKTAHWCIVCAKSNCHSAIDFLSPEPCPQYSL